MSAKNKTIEDKMNELRDIATWFESDAFSLAEAAKKFEEANTLAADIEHDLDAMQNQITVLKQSFEEV